MMIENWLRGVLAVCSYCLLSHPISTAVSTNTIYARKMKIEIKFSLSLQNVNFYIYWWVSKYHQLALNEVHQSSSSGPPKNRCKLRGATYSILLKCISCHLCFSENRIKIDSCVGGVYTSCLFCLDAHPSPIRCTYQLFQTAQICASLGVCLKQNLN